MKTKTLVNIACLSTCLILPNLTYAIDYKGPLKKDETKYLGLILCGEFNPVGYLSVNGPTTGYPLNLKAEGFGMGGQNICEEVEHTEYAPGHLTTPEAPQGGWCAWKLTVHNASGRDIEYVDLDGRCGS